MIQFNCSCGQTLSAQDADAGKVTKCPKCSAQLTIPSLLATQPSQPPPAAAIRPRDEGRRDYADDVPRRQPQQAGMSVMALMAMITGLLSFCCPVFLSILAIIFGFVGMAQVRGGRSGGIMAIIGIITGILSLLLIIPAGIFGYLKVQEAQGRNVSRNNMMQMGIAMHHFNDVHKKMPAHAIHDKDGRPLLSWRVTILPYIEQNNLYRQFKLDEPYDSPHNRPLLKHMPRIYAHPYDPQAAKNGMTYYQVFVGEKGERGARPVFVKGEFQNIPGNPPAPSFTSSLSRITAQDGSSNTIFVVEASTPVPWTKPEDISYSANRPLPKLGVKGYSSLIGLFDGSVRPLPANISDETLRRAITADDGMPLGRDW